jgi:hypothetical protein
MPKMEELDISGTEISEISIINQYLINLKQLRLAKMEKIK